MAGRSGTTGSLFLDRPDFCFLRNSDGKIEEGRHLRKGERIQSGSEMVLLDCVVGISARVFPDRQRITLTSGALSPAAASPTSGSRFQPIAVDDEAGQHGAEEVAVLAANTVLTSDDCDDEGGPLSTVSRRGLRRNLCRSSGTMQGF